MSPSQILLPASLQPPETIQPLAGIDLDTIRQVGASHAATIGSRVTDGSLSLSMEGASTIELNVHDRERAFIYDEGLFSKGAKIALRDDLIFELTKITKTGDEFTALYEDELVAAFRKPKGARRVLRDKVTRAEFIYQLARDAKIPFQFFSPELTKVQPIAGKTRAATRATAAASDNAREPGFSTTAGLTVKGAKANDEQLRNGATILAVANRLNAPEKVQVGAIADGIIESELINGRGAGADVISDGVYQAISDANGNRRDLKRMTEAFLTGDPGNSNTNFHAGGLMGYLKAHPNASIGEAAYWVQKPAAMGDYISKVNGRYQEALAWVRAYNGGDIPASSSSSSGTVTKVEPYAFERKKDESSWAAMTRLADEVNWRLFVVGRTLFYIAEEDLMRSRPRATLSEDVAAVDTIDFDLDIGKKAAEATVTARAELWAAPPGTLVALEHMGPADGRWLVSAIERPLESMTAEITLKRPSPSLPEPAPETTTTSTNTTTSTASGGKVAVTGELRDRIVAIARNQVGYHEGPGNQNKYGPQGAWCAMFVAWVWREAGVKGYPFAGFYVPDWGNLHSNPTPGDAVSYHSHIGIVVEVIGNQIKTVEGNFGDAVQARGPFSAAVGSFPPGGPHSIVGYASPPGA